MRFQIVPTVVALGLGLALAGCSRSEGSAPPSMSTRIAPTSADRAARISATSVILGGGGTKRASRSSRGCGMRPMRSAPFEIINASRSKESSAPVGI